MKQEVYLMFDDVMECWSVFNILNEAGKTRCLFNGTREDAKTILEAYKKVGYVDVTEY
jgi:hypothetical protein